MSIPLFFATLALSLLPEGWISVKNPPAALLRCGSFSHQVWGVAVRDGSVQIERDFEWYRGSGPTIPFELSGLHFLGRRHTLALPGGFVVGTDLGEEGGWLSWVGASGMPIQQLASENVHGLIQRGKEVLALQGLMHLSINQGTARWLGPTPRGRWKVTGAAKLDSAPQTFVATADAVYVLTFKSLSRIGADRKVNIVQQVQTGPLFPSSMVVDAQGVLWVGMRHFVLRLQPSGTSFTEEWLTPKGCDQARVVGDLGDDCVCVK